MSARYKIILTISVVVGIIIVYSVTQWSQSTTSNPPPSLEGRGLSKQGEQNMKLSSSAFQPNQNIPAKYTCDGQDINPPLTIAAVPAGTKSLALIVDDPDAPGGDWVHWLVWNIKPETAAIAENSVPTGASQGTTDFGRVGWGGPCPPSGTHHYQFKLFALDTELSLVAAARKADLEQMIAGHILEQANLVGLYQRQ